MCGGCWKQAVKLKQGEGCTQKGFLYTDLQGFSNTDQQNLFNQ